MEQNLTDEEVQSLLDTKNEQDWNDACDKVKRARNGQYPQDWYFKVIMSGLLTEIKSTWA